MELRISGLKCDYCDYRDETIDFSEYKNSINKGCPKCGKNLLTYEEYNKCLRIITIFGIINKILGVLKFLNPLYYIRLVFGDRRVSKEISINFPMRKKEE